MRIAMVPAEPLADRWYAIRVDLAGLSGPARHLGGGALADGDVWFSRFRPGAQAVVRQVRLVREADELGVEVHLSERVRDPRPDAQLITTGLPDCSSGDDPTGAVADGSPVLRVWCRVPSGTLQAVIELAPDIPALVGGFVTDIDGGTPRPIRVPVPAPGTETLHRHALGGSP